MLEISRFCSESRANNKSTKVSGGKTGEFGVLIMNKMPYFKKTKWV